jgi:cation diffusion facilitator family transporter
VRSYAHGALYSVLVNLLPMAMKYFLGQIQGTLALKADAVHSFGDVISALTIFVGIVISDRKTRTFPEDLYKVENVLALLSALVIVYSAVEIGLDALLSKTSRELTHFPQVIGGILLTIVVAFVFSRYELRIGLKMGSPSLLADAKHVYADLLSTVDTLFSISEHTSVTLWTGT